MHLEFEYFYFVLIHLELKRNHTRYQTKMSKIDTHFRTEKGPTSITNLSSHCSEQFIKYQGLGLK